MCDLFLVLAQTDEGVSCFAVPRILPDGGRNPFALQRLKDKLGNHSNASSEVEFAGTWGRMVGEPGRGVPTIIEMVGHTRLDCVIGSAAGMRAAVANATWHTAHRSAFGKLLADQPLMRNVLADLAIESEAATALAMRLARAYDEGDTALRRLGTAIGKYHVCKRFPGVAFEALECLGGNGYVEESGMPRIYREAPLNSSGRARATSTRSTSCGAGQGAGAFDVFWASWTRRAARTRATTRGSHACGARSPIRSRSSSARAGWWRTWRSPGRPPARAPRAASRRRRVLRGAARRRPRLNYGTLPAATDLGARSSTRALPA
jgi:hypothetical protein